MEPWLWYSLASLVTYVVAGQPSSLPYTPEISGQCTNSTTAEYFQGSIGCCRKCLPGTRLKKTCTREENTVCEECTSNTFSDSFNYFSNCFRCTKCEEEKGLLYARNCSKHTNALCVCKPGWFCLFDYRPPACSECQEYRKCPPGKGARSPGTPDRDITCASCPSGTFSNESSTHPCKPHTGCESQGRSVLHPGTATSDTVCGGLMVATPSLVITQRLQTTVRTSPETPVPRGPSITFTSPAPGLKEEAVLISSTSSNTLSSRTTETKMEPYLIGLLAVFALMLVFGSVVTVWMCRRKGTFKPALDDMSEKGHGLDTAQLSGSTERQGLLSEGETDPSTSSSSSSDNQSQGTGISQDCVHVEQPSVSSPCLSLSITATFKYLNPATGACTVPISSCVQQPEPDLPLSQEEELCKSCEQEDGKSALQSVQESGMTVC